MAHVSRLLQADRAVVVTGVVIGGDVRDRDSGRFVLGMDHLAAADRDPDVRDPGFEGVREEDQITRRPVTPLDRGAKRRLARRAVTDIDTDCVQHDILGEPRAIEAARLIARVDVGVSQELHRVIGDRLTIARTAATAGDRGCVRCRRAGLGILIGSRSVSGRVFLCRDHPASSCEDQAGATEHRDGGSAAKTSLHERGHAVS